MQASTNFSYKGAVLFITAIGFLFLAGLINFFGVWKNWYEEGAGWLLFGNIITAIGFFVCLSHAVALNVASRRYCPTCHQRIK